LCRFVGRDPAAVADATFRRIGAAASKLPRRMLQSGGAASKSTGGAEGVGAKPNDIEIADGPKRSIAATRHAQRNQCSSLPAA
jgi:hypothetical protein